MKKLLLSISALFSLTPLFAQHQADNWFFGVLAGVNFTTGVPVALTTGAENTTEGCSAISDNAGNLLFYTDGVSVWNKNSQVMPNGTGLLGGTSSTQSALAVPRPGSTTEYYIFTVDETGGPNGFEYSIVDMTLDGGLGDISIKNVLIQNNVTEKLTAVEQGASGNFWVAVHDWGSDAFYAYLLTSSGLSAPVISHAGIVHSNLNIQYTYGQMKFNTCGNMIGVAIGYLDTVEVFDFNNSTGVVSNPYTLPMGAHVYGLEFSEDGSKLYVTTYDPLGTFVQFDLSVMQTDSILASKIMLTTQEDMYGIQLATDGKIYTVHAWDHMLGVVNFPNLSGFNSNFVLSGFDLDPSFNGISAALGTPGFVTSFLRKAGRCEVTGVTSAEEKSNGFNVYPNPFHYKTTIRFEDSFSKKNLHLKVYDCLNRLVREDEVNSSTSYTFYEGDLKPGIYFLQIAGESSYRIAKLVID